MKNLIKIFFLLIVSQNTFAMISDGMWTTSLGKSAPSCSLYRKRVANYYQRVSEVDMAERALKGNFNRQEISRMVELWERTGVPLLTSATATFSSTVEIGDYLMRDMIMNPAAVGVKIDSNLFKWESTSFIFPDEFFKVVVDTNSHLMKIELEMQFAQACLRSDDLLLTIMPRIFENQGQSEYRFKLDKTKWDLMSTIRD